MPKEDTQNKEAEQVETVVPQPEELSVAPQPEEPSLAAQLEELSLAAQLEGLLFASDRVLTPEALAEALADPGKAPRKEASEAPRKEVPEDPGKGGSEEPHGRPRISEVKRGLKELGESLLASTERGVYLETVGSGYQLRTKPVLREVFHRTLKVRPFRLSGPALEVMAIVAYEQPCVKARIDEVRAVESGHLLRTLMDRKLVAFAGRSSLPGKPMLYKTTKKFLEIFGLKGVQDLPQLDEIRQILPQVVVDEQAPKLEDLVHPEENLSTAVWDGETDLRKITDELRSIQVTSPDLQKKEDVVQ